MKQQVKQWWTILSAALILIAVAATAQSVTPREMLRYYKKNKSDFTRPEQRSAAHIQIFSI